MVGIYCSSLPDGAPRSSSSAPDGGALSAEWAGVLLRQMDASGVIPQLTAILSPAAGPPAPLITDFVFTAAAAEGGRGRSSQQDSAFPVGGRTGLKLSGSRDIHGAGEGAAALPALTRLPGGLFRLLLGEAFDFLQQQLGLPPAAAGRPSRVREGTGVSAAGLSRGGCCRCCGRTEHAAGVQCGSSREAVLRLRELLSYLPASNMAPARQVWPDACIFAGLVVQVPFKDPARAPFLPSWHGGANR